MQPVPIVYVVKYFTAVEAFARIVQIALAPDWLMDPAAPFVVMEGAVWPSATVALKLDVQPERAAVFLDDAFVGRAGEFGGAFHSMLVSPGKHRIKVELPGYQQFETEVNLLVGQKSEVRTELVPGSIEQAGLLIKQPNQQSFQP